MKEQMIREYLEQIDERESRRLEKKYVPKKGKDSDKYHLYPYDDQNGILMVKNPRFAPTFSHSHEYIEMNYMFSGSCEQTINGQTMILKEHQLTLIDMNTVHSLGVCKEHDLMVNFLFPKSYLDANFFNRVQDRNAIYHFLLQAINPEHKEMSYMVFDIKNNERLLLFLNELIYECLFPGPNTQTIQDSLLSLVLIDLVSSAETVIDHSLLSRSSKTIYGALQYIERNFMSCTLEDVAHEVGVSKGYLTTQLKEQTGRSYIELITEYKLKTAEHLLKSRNDLSIDRIAYECGYQNLTFFYRKFKELFGLTPKKYRMKLEKENQNKKEALLPNYLKKT